MSLAKLLVIWERFFQRGLDPLRGGLKRGREPFLTLIQSIEEMFRRRPEEHESYHVK